jgi:ABC-2 type transport system permease protein
MSFRRVWILVQKEFTQLLRDRSMIPLIFVMPVLQLVLFGYVIGTDVKDLRTAILDQDRSIASERVIDAFTSSGYFVEVARPTDDAGVQTALDGNVAQVAVIIPRGFADQVTRGRATQISIIVDGSDSKTASVAQGYAGSIVASLSGKLYPRPGGTSGTAAAGGIDAQVRVLFNPTMRAVNTMVPALLAFLLMMSTQNLMSQSIVKERERGTLEQLFVTPIGRAEYLLGKLLPYVVVAILQIVLVFTVGTLWFKVPFSGSIAVLAVGLGLFMIAALGQGMLVSLMSKTRYQAQQANTFLMVPSMMLSGFVFPLSSMPALLLPLTYLIPLRYALVIVRSNFVKGSDFIALWPQFLALIIFSAAIFGLGLSRFQKRLND